MDRAGGDVDCGSEGTGPLPCQAGSHPGSSQLSCLEL